MKPRRLQFAPGFAAGLKKLEPEERSEVWESVRKFRNRSAENALMPERKSGLKGILAFRVNSSLRVFYVQKKDSQGRAFSELFHVGPHDDYRTILRKRPAIATH